MAVRIACECDDTALMPNACLSAFMDLFLRRCLSLLCGTHCECFRCIIDCCENMHWVGDSIVECRRTQDLKCFGTRMRCMSSQQQ